MSPFEHKRIRRDGYIVRKPITTSKRIGLLWVLLVILAMIGFLYYTIGLVGNTSIPAKTYDIDKGTTLSTLNASLGLGISDTRYKLWARWFAPKNIKIEVGEYKAEEGTTLNTFLTETLKKPLHSDITITILPGWNIYDIDEYIAKKGIAPVGDFIKITTENFSDFQKKYSFLAGANTIEGFLYPDTYRIRSDSTIESVANTLLKEFGKQIGESYTKLDPKTAYSTLILASIVEREEGNIRNQPIVAGILSKRVKEGIALGADATVCYGYAKTQKQCTPSFIGSVIRDNNPYNTRVKRGYTPTPISSISKDTWQAALHPDGSPYYYYLHDSNGQIHYAKTNDEHNLNKSQYIK